MRLKSLLCIGLTIFISCVSSLPAEETPGNQSAESARVERIKGHINFLASPELKGRSGYEALVTARYLKSRFKEHGLKPLFENDSYFQPIPGNEGPDGKPVLLGRNVGAWIPGSDPKFKNEFIIISAHYDHLGVRGGRIFPGADDNASGVSMMLEVARAIATAQQKPKRSIVFVGFDLEEHMLWGSRWFAAHPPWPIEQVKLFITADMIGRSLGNLPLPTVFVLGSEHAPILKETLDAVGTPDGLETARLGIDLVGTRSDYGPFRDRKIPFLFFSTGEHPDYHSPRDTPDKINFSQVAKISELVEQLTVKTANSKEAPVWTDEITPSLDEAVALNRIATLVLEQKSASELTDLQRFVVTHAKTKTRQILDKGSMTIGERNWLTRVSQLLLLSVF